MTRHLTCVVLVVCLAGTLASSGRAGDRNKHGPSKGPEGGDAFSDGVLPAEAVVVGVKVRHGDLIDSVELLYKTPKGKVVSLGKHGGDGGEESIFMLEEGELIKGVKGDVNELGVTNLTIVTNKRKVPFGPGGGGQTFDFVTADQHLVGFYGKTGLYGEHTVVTRIGIWTVPRNK